MDLNSIGNYVKGLFNQSKNSNTQPQVKQLPQQDFLTRVQGIIGTTAKSTFTNLPSFNLGQNLAQTIQRPFDYMNMNSMVNTDLEQARRNTDLAVKLQQQGKTKQAQDLFQRSRDLSNNATSMASSFGQQNKQIQGNVIKNTIGTDLSLLGAGYAAQNPLLMGLGGAISGTMNKLNGGSFSEGFGKGVAESLPYAGVMQFTSPAINMLAPKIASYVKNPFFSMVAEKGLVGTGNVLENRLLNKVSGTEDSLQNDVFAFTLGALFHSPNQNVKGWQDLPQSTRTSIIRLANKAGLDTTPTNRVADDVWDKTPKFLDEIRYAIKKDGFGKTVNKLPMGLSVKQITPEERAALKASQTDPLLQEASKYKSAEEFVKAQGDEIFHASTRPRTIGSEPLFFSTKNLSSIHGENVLTGIAPKKILETNPFTDGDVRKNAQKWIDQGYDAISWNTRGNGKTIVLLNPKVSLKTKSQLTDIWNKAQGVIPKSENIKIKPNVEPTFTQKAEQIIRPQENIKVKSNKIPTQQEVASTIDQKINDLMQDTGNYSTMAPEGGNKTASFYTRKLREMGGNISSKVEKGMSSENPLIRNASLTMNGFFKELGMSPERMNESLKLKGGLSTAQQRPYDVMESLYSALGKDAEKSKVRIDAVLDPEASKLKLKFDDLNETEQGVYLLLRQGFDLVHDISYANGNISPELYKANLGKYSARLYANYELPQEVNQFVKTAYKSIQTDPYKTKGGITQWKIDNKLNDPIYAMGKRLSQVESNRTIKQYTDFIASQSHLVSDVERPGFTKLSDSKAYGSLSGKYIQNSAAEELKGYFFANEGLNKLYDAFRSYDRWTPRQIQKKLLTVFNPTTNVGNITTDNVFGFLVGVDPMTLNKNLISMKSNPAKFKQYGDYLMKQGIVGTDITRTDFQSRIGSIDELAGMGEKNFIMKGINKASDKVQSFYGGTDDAYKVAALKSLLDQGKTLQEATKLVSDGFQNYASVGKFYDFASKVPIVGQPFIKFQGDLIRIIKNAAVNKPLSLITFLATLKAVSMVASKASGETDEQRTMRENRFGATKIPGLDISLSWQTPIGEINVARYISPFNTTNLNESDTAQTANKLLPFVPEIAYDKSGQFDVPGSIAMNANDPLTSPLIQAAVNRDFRNKPISDPKASQYFGSDLPPEEQMKNTATFLGRGYLPPQVNSLIDVKSAADGGANMYGSKQTVPQALARVAGLKVQQATPEIVKKNQETSNYFDAQTPAFNNLKAAEKAEVLSIPKQEPSDIRAKQSKYLSLLQYPAVYNYFREIAVNKVNGDVSKIDPLYTYPKTDVQKYMTYQSLGGSDLGSADAKALYKAEPVIAEIAKARSAFYKANPIEGSTYETNRPIASEYAQKQMDAGNWTDPEVKAYLDANTAWKNNNRELAGLPPLESGFSSWPKQPKKVSFKKISIPKVANIKIGGSKLTKLKAIKQPSLKIAKVKTTKLQIPKGTATIKLKA